MTVKHAKSNANDAVENNQPSMGKSLVEIFNITGHNTDFSSYNSQTEKQRMFKDERGVFREMGEEKHKNQTKTVAE